MSPQFAIILALILSLTLSCSSSKEKPEAWKPQLDQVIVGQHGGLDFGRTHYVIHKRSSMNQMRENQISAFMNKVCKDRKVQVMRRYQSESDFVSLKNQYSMNVPIKVYEFNCR